MDPAELGSLIQERNSMQAELDEITRHLAEAGTEMIKYGNSLQNGSAIPRVGGEPDAKHFDLARLSQLRKRGRELQEQIARISAKLKPLI